MAGTKANLSWKAKYQDTLDFTRTYVTVYIESALIMIDHVFESTHGSTKQGDLRARKTGTLLEKKSVNALRKSKNVLSIRMIYPNFRNESLEFR